MTMLTQMACTKMFTSKALMNLMTIRRLGHSTKPGQLLILYKEFFKPVAHSEKPVKGDKKKHVKCMPCTYVLYSLFFKMSTHI